MATFRFLHGRRGNRVGSVKHYALFSAALAAAAIAPACSSSGAGHEESSDPNSTEALDALATDSFSCPPGKSCIRPDRIKIVGELEYGDVAYAVPYSSTPQKYAAFKFSGTADDAVNITVSNDYTTLDSFLCDSEFNILNLKSGALSENFALNLVETGSPKYYIVFRTQDLSSTTVSVTLLGPETEYVDTRIAQTDIDQGKFKASRLFHFGDFMFGDHEFTTDEGLGNALSPPLAGPNPRPNSKKIHTGKFGGPDAKTCNECHFVGGTDGTGDVAHNLLQDGDGVNLSTALPRQPRQVIGVGALQQLGIEMTADLQAQLAAAKNQAASTQAAVAAKLSSKGIGFGFIVAQPTGAVDFTGLQGVDSDLVVKPLGWKGRVANARRFVEGGFQVHLGMASQALIAKNCSATPIPGTVGDGPDCTDPDKDGVRDEITEAQLTEMALYATLLQIPVRQNPTDATALTRVQTGEKLFAQAQCGSCHVTSLKLNSTIHAEAPDLSGGAPFKVDLTVDGRIPRLTKNADGSATVELFSDLKRHDMGASLADQHSTFGTFAPNLWLTSPLWGVGQSAPYLHDGRAATLQDAITLHDGEALASRNAFLALTADNQKQIVEFLNTLSRDPRHTDD